MRKSIALGFICFIFLFTTRIAYANGIALFMGTNLISNLPEPMAVGDGMLVPAGLIPYIGGEVVSLSGNSVRFRTTEYDVSVNGGDTTAIVNGTARPMGAGAVFEKGTLYVPLGFLSDMLNLRVSWDQLSTAIRLTQRTATPTPVSKPLVAIQAPSPTLPVPVQLPAPSVTPLTTKQVAAPVTPVTAKPVVTAATPVVASFSAGARLWPGEGTSAITMAADLDNGASSFTLTGIALAAVSISFVPAPNRLVVDVEEYLPPTDLEPWQVAHPVVSRVRVAPYKGKGRIVFDLTEPTGYQVEEVSGGVRISLNRVLRSVDFTPSPIGGVLNLDLPGESSYTVFRLSGPDRLVLDFNRTTLGGGARNVSLAGGPIKAMRVSQFNTTTTRVVFDLSNNVAAPVRIPGDSLQLAIGAVVQRISMANLGDNRQVVLLEGLGLQSGKLSRLSNPDRLVLDLDNTWSASIFTTQSFSGALATEVRASQFTPQTFRIAINIGSGARARLIELSQNMLAILLEPALLPGSRIVVDAGHGGFDPGAKGRTLGILESDVNLDIARQVAALLQKQKAEVALIRADNNHVFLADRPNLAATSKPDVFVSIHANSTTLEQSPTGTETLYWNERDGSYELARSIQNEVVAALGTVNRGVKQQNLLVLRESTVPAVLVEVGFLSHPEEEARLADPEFRRKAAEGIVSGLTRYLQPNAAQKESQATLTPQELQQLLENNPQRIYLPSE